MESARKLIRFIDNSPTPFHAVHNAASLLEANGFRKVREAESWASGSENGLRKGGKYYFTRNQSSLCAFVVPNNFKPGNGFNIIATHTDSPCLKIKPISKNEGSDCMKVGIETYGGGLWYTWFDRDLSIAGRVFVENENGGLEHKLIHIDEPILRIPSLCIHLNREVSEKFTFNNETNLVPILSTKFMSENGPQPEGVFHGIGSHHYALQNLIAERLSVQPKNIKTYELSLCDHQKGEIGGIFNEFIFSPRLDNLFSTYCATESLISESNEESLESETNVRLIALFDHEEVGSCSVVGADSTLMVDTIRRISLSFSENPNVEIDAFDRAIRNSFVISADMSHAIHPSYPEKHEANHAPKMHKGISIKHNGNQRYATSGWSGTIIRHIAQRNNIPYQEYVVRNDSSCGSTVGPILSRNGLRTVDVGAPQLSMHSIREMAGTSDVENTINLFRAFYREFTNLDGTLIVD